MSTREERLDVAGLVALAPADHQRERLPAALGPHVHLGREAAAAAAERLMLLAANGAGRVLVGPDDRPVHEVRAPVQPPGLVGLTLQRRQHVRPDAGRRPAAEAAPGRAPGTESLRQITPRRAGAKDPEDRAHDGTVITGRAAGRRPLRGEQRREAVPLLVGQLISTAPPDLPLDLPLDPLRRAVRPPRRGRRAR